MDVRPTTGGHVVAVPYPGRSHVNAMLNLCKLLLSNNSHILLTFVLTEEWLALIGDSKPHNIRFLTIPNVIPSEHGRANDFAAFFEAVMTKMEAPFERLLNQLQPPPTVIIYDTFMFWVVRVANRSNIPVASFWPMSASVFAVFKHYRLLHQNGHYPVNVSEDGEKRVDYIPGNSSIRLADFPLNDESWRTRKILELVLNVLPWVHKAQYLLFATVYELEPRAIEALKAEFSIPIYTVCPTIPYCSNDHIDASKDDYFEWLDKQPSGSVLYISQGSFLSVSNAQRDEIAIGVRESGVRFMWVQPGESDRLKELCGDRGLVLAWCDQIRVLQHPAIGGFWSHCGWNSTREGVFSGVPFLAFPIYVDQPLNGKLIAEEWKVGWRVKRDVKNDTLIARDEIASLVKKFMDVDDDEMRDMRKRSIELKQLCQHAIAPGGSSETDMNAFLSHVLQGVNPNKSK
ncbi:hypothetical protein Fmac_031317 [Flemingia macrophylla]|uniref:Uncharacterized protein n=1 Tax=Flemingia macrophylla TaxID=520843 RepID=A0ABD1L1R7_9FABA